MGIKGLLPYLKSISKVISLKDIKGSVVAVDSYCWLHKSAIGCSQNLAMGIDTDIHINYCLKFLKLLLVYDIKVIMVFDGNDLPAKENVDQKRFDLRETNFKIAQKLLSDDKHSEAKSYFDKSVQISHEIALQLLKKAVNLGVKCIVAPYEADAQLAYLGLKGYVDYVITEDSDLLAFGTPNVIFKLDIIGNGVLINKFDINKVIGLSPEKYSFDKFRYMCIMAGCDYFQGIHKIGLITAANMMQKTQTSQFSDFLKRINMYTKSRIVLPEQERLSAINANYTFLHQVVFDPATCLQVRINSTSFDGSDVSSMEFAGIVETDAKLCRELAIGLRHPVTKEIMPDFFEELPKFELDKYEFYYGRISKAPVSFNMRTVHSSLSAPNKKPVELQRHSSTQNTTLKVQCQYPWKSSSQPSLAKEMEQLKTQYIGIQKDQESTIIVAGHCMKECNAIDVPTVEQSQFSSDLSLDNQTYNEAVLTSDPFIKPKRSYSQFQIDSGIENLSNKSCVDKENTLVTNLNSDASISLDQMKRPRHSLRSSSSIVQSSSVSKQSLIQQKLPFLFKRKYSDTEDTDLNTSQDS